MTTLFRRWRRSSRKAPGPDPLGQVPVRGGQDPDLDRRALARAEGPELAVLQDAEELGLDGHRDLGDLVEEDRPSVGLLEQAALVPVGAGEGALLVAEELRFEQALRDGGAVADDERLVLGGAEAVDGPGHDFLAGPGLAGDEDAREVLGDVLDEPEDLEHRGVPADQALEVVLPLELLLEMEGFAAERTLAGDPPEDVGEDVALVGPGDEVGRAGADDVEGGLPADGFAAEEDVDQNVELFDLLQDQEPGGEGVAGVDEDDPDAVLPHDAEVIVVGLGEEDVEVGRDGGFLDGLVEREVVRDDQKVGLRFHRSPFFSLGGSAILSNAARSSQARKMGPGLRRRPRVGGDAKTWSLLFSLPFLRASPGPGSGAPGPGPLPRSGRP